jgi:hypothetical protein
MFIEPMLRYILLPFIILIASLLVPLILKFYRKRAKKKIKQRKSELRNLKQDRVSLQNQVKSKDLTDFEKEETQKELANTLEDEAKARFKLLTQRASLAFANFVTWIARLVSILMLTFGWTFTVAMVGASTAVIYVSVMSTVDCSADGTVKQHKHKDENNKSEKGEYKGGEGELPKAEGIKPHVEDFRQIIYKKFGIDDIGGYRPGDPQDHGQGLALDVMVPDGSKLGDDVAQFAIDNMEAAGITYIIWKQRFYRGVDNKYGAANTWNKMEDRGSKTENHFDHVHISFGASKGSGEIKDGGSSSSSSSYSKKSVDSSTYGFGDLTDEVTGWAKSYSGFTFIGDSLGVGVEPKLKSYFPNSTFDSKVSRAFEHSDSTLSGIETAKKLESEKKVKDIVVIALGTNQMPTPLLMDSMVDALPSAKKIIWVTTASQGGGGSYNTVEHDKIAEVIKSYVGSRSNMAYLDWNRYVEEKFNWSELTSDSVHMNDKGYVLYSKFLTRGIYDVVEGGSSDSSEDSLLTKAIKKIKCKPKHHHHGTSTKSKPSGLSSTDGQDNPPADAFTSWAYRPEDLPAGLKPYILDPKNYGMDFGLPGNGWFQTSNPELNGQCVALTISLGDCVWGRPHANVQGNGIDQANAWASIFGNSVTTTPRRGAIFSSKEHPVYGHTGIVCTVFKDGSILTCEQNLPLAGWNYRGEQYVWCFRMYREEQWKAVGMTFAYDDTKTPILK